MWDESGLDELKKITIKRYRNGFLFVLFIFLTNIYNMVKKSTACHGNHLSMNK
jgi:hypothetical protein